MIFFFQFRRVAIYEWQSLWDSAGGELMRDFFTWRKVLGLVGVLIVGGAGSSLSDLIFKPLILDLSGFFLSVATLGLASVTDGMYADVAHIDFERTGSALLSAFTGMQIGVAISLFSVVAFISMPRVAKRLEQWRAQSLANSSSFRTVLYCWLVAMVLTVGFLTISNIRVLYTVQAASYIEQLQRIVSPKLTEDQRLEFRSRVAQISKRSDYVAISEDLKHIAEVNKLYVPAFDIF